MSEKHIVEKEFIVLTEGGLGVFEAFLHEKEEKISGSFPVKGRSDQRNLLVLCYPGPKQENDDFNKFFSSPDNLNSFSNSYRGVFAVELTDYVNEPDNPRLSDLFAFMRERKEITFILFAVDDGSGSVARLSEKVSRRTDCRVVFATERGLECKNSHNGKTKSFGY